MIPFEIMKVDFDKNGGLVPAIVQSLHTGEVLMHGYMNRKALETTVESSKVTFWSRSKQRLWTKGESSGNHLTVDRVEVDCDRDTLLITAIPSGPTCHRGTDSCWGDRAESRYLHFIGYLERVIADRSGADPEGSYTAALLKRGINKIAQKVGEEAIELVIEAKDDNEDLFLSEAADLLYHYLVLLRAKDVKLSQVIDRLRDRH